jgi:hypothetical protein
MPIISSKIAHCFPHKPVEKATIGNIWPKLPIVLVGQWQRTKEDI